MTGAHIAVYGAYGHTGRLVTAELRRRGNRLTLIGRDPEQMRTLAAIEGENKLCFSVDAPDWAAVLFRADILVNCAGPFVDTAAPLIEAALNAGVNYIDTCGEPQVVLDVSERFDRRARERRCMVAPATGFYGGLGDLLITAAAGDWTSADRVELDFIIDGWNPTAGTRAAVARMAGRRLVYADGGLREEAGEAYFVERDYSPAFGRQSVMQGYPSPEAVLVPRHFAAPTIAIGMGALALRDLRDAKLSGPRAGEKTQQRFLVEARLYRSNMRRVVRCTGQDIYASTALIVGEVVSRIPSHKSKGVVSLGVSFDASDFLSALRDQGLQTIIEAPSPCALIA